MKEFLTIFTLSASEAIILATIAVILSSCATDRSWRQVAPETPHYGLYVTHDLKSGKVCYVYSEPDWGSLSCRDGDKQ